MYCFTVFTGTNWLLVTTDRAMSMLPHSLFIRLLVYLYSAAILFIVYITLFSNTHWPSNNLTYSNSNSTRSLKDQYIPTTTIISTTMPTTIFTTIGIPDEERVNEELSNRTLLSVGDELPRIRNYQELSKDAKVKRFT